LAKTIIMQNTTDSLLDYDFQDYLKTMTKIWIVSKNRFSILYYSVCMYNGASLLVL